MDTKHNDDTLKTMEKTILRKEGDGQPPATPQPKKQCNKCIEHIYCSVKKIHYCSKYVKILLDPYTQKTCAKTNRSS